MQKNCSLFISIIFSFLIGTSCHIMPSGTYVHQEDENLLLTFSGNSFLAKEFSENDYHPLFTCNDTIAFGEWMIDDSKEFIRLQSPENLVYSVIDFYVEEQELKNLDSIYFKIIDPIESHYKRYNYSEKAREIEYTINIKSNMQAQMHEINNKIFNTSEIAIRRIKGAKLTAIELIITMNSKFQERYSMIKELYTVPYDIQIPSANFFLIELPNLTHCQIGAKILNQDFIKIIDKKTLEWDGHFYLKKQ